jgi:hypothetical protein
MKKTKRGFLIYLICSLIGAALYADAWASDKWTENDPITDEWNMIDLLVARPVGVAAGIIGTAVFILSLPFTIPTGSHDEAAEMFIVRPFSFSFCRKFPDEDM